MRKMSSFSGKGLSTNCIVWKRWMLWSKWILQWKFRWWAYKLVGCCKLSFYANESCGLFLAMIEMTRHVHRVFGLWQWCNFSGIVFRVFIHAYSIIVEYDTKRKYPEEYPTVDRVGSEKKLFRAELIASSFLFLISKQARVTAFLNSVLFPFFILDFPVSFIYQTKHSMMDQSSVGQVPLRRQRPKSDSEHFDSHESYIRGESLIQNTNLALNMIYLGSKGGTAVRGLSSDQCGLGTTPGVDDICGLSLSLVHSFALRGFSPGTPVFLSHQNSTVPNSKNH